MLFRSLAFSRNSGQFAVGLSPRAGLALLAAAQAWALMASRDFVLPEDVQAVLPAVVGHRLRSADTLVGPGPKALQQAFVGVHVPA